VFAPGCSGPCHFASYQAAQFGKMYFQNSQRFDVFSLSSSLSLLLNLLRMREEKNANGAKASIQTLQLNRAVNPLV
jgi:hypothetical protein